MLNSFHRFFLTKQQLFFQFGLDIPYLYLNAIVNTHLNALHTLHTVSCEMSSALQG